jgi:ornithine cyclodeaminase/alanine dehydrogenase-like protein (mu-crystallin family)
VAALRQLFISGCEVPQRHSHPIAVPGGHPGTLLLMPAWRPGARLGLKTVSIFPSNAALGKPGLHSTYLLFDANTGEPLAQIDGNQITSRRTAAASALAASFLARAGASRLLLVGAGRVASVMAEAMRAVRTIGQVTLWNRHAAGAEALAERLREQGFSASATSDLEAAVAQADIISCATLSTAPLIRGEWLRPGVHLDLVGSFTPAMCEADAACFARSRVFIDTHEAMAKAGDLLQAIAAKAFAEADLQGTLAELCRGTRRGRHSAGDITLFKSVGSALEDLAAAELVYDGVLNDPA